MSRKRYWGRCAAALGALCLWMGLEATASAAPGAAPDPAGAALPTAAMAADASAALARTREELQRLRKVQDDLEQSMQRITRRAEVRAQGREFSQAVIGQLRRLPRAERLAAERQLRDRILEVASDANLSVASQLAAMPETDAFAAQREPMIQLERLQRELLETLLASNAAEAKLIQHSDAAREELSRLLFWVPARPGRQSMSELAPSLAWTTLPLHWQQAGAVLVGQAGRAPLWPALAVLAALALWLARRRLLGRLQALAPSRKGFGKHHAGHTLLALLTSLAIALPGPLLLWAAASWLARAPDSQAFSLALGDALWATAGLWLGISGLAWLLQPGSVAVSHFGWDDTAMGFAARSLRAFAWLFLPLLFVGTLNGLDHAPFGNRESLGRLCFSLAMLLLSGFFFHLLRRGSVAMQRLRAHAPHSWVLKWHGAWLPLTMAVPVGIALLGLAGYFVAAGYFFGRMSMTLLLVLGAVLLYGLMAQWVHLQRAQLARTRIEQEGQALAEAAEGNTDAQAVPVPRIDIAALGEQTRSLFDMLITLLLLTGVWLIWKDALPVLSVVSDFTLWTYPATVDGKETALPLTVGNLFLTLLVAAVTALVMRNIGALLDIVLLQRLEMQADATYAIKVVSRYLIAAAGVFIASNILGIRWTDVHWLVAALGVGLGFGLQEIFANFVSGLIVLAERPIRIGDVVTVGDVTGTVSRIRARATAVLDFDNKEVIIPNKAFITERVVNWTLSNQTTRLLIKVGVAYGSDVAAVQQLLLEAVRANGDVLGEPEPTVYFVGFGDSALNFEVRAFVDAFAKRLRVQHEINLAVERALAASGIEIPFPQRDLHMRSGPWPSAPLPAAP